MERQLAGYSVFDTKTKAYVKEYAPDKRKNAVNWADKKDLEYGAVRYVVEAFYV